MQFPLFAKKSYTSIANSLRHSVSIITEFDSLLQCSIKNNHFQKFFLEEHNVRVNAFACSMVNQRPCK